MRTTKQRSIRPASRSTLAATIAKDGNIVDDEVDEAEWRDRDNRLSLDLCVDKRNPKNFITRS